MGNRLLILTTLKGVAQMLYRRVERGDSVELSTLALLEHSVRRMEILVNDLLNTSLISFPGVRLALEQPNPSFIANSRPAVRSRLALRTVPMEVWELLLRQ